MLTKMRTRLKRALGRVFAEHENGYWRELTEDQIARGAHRSAVGGLWDEIGPLQLRFLMEQGLRAEDRLLDVGCGALRGGIHFVRYLERGHYYGIDRNRSLIKAGRRELALAGFEASDVHLLVNADFDCSEFGVEFDYAIAVSLFTHLYMNHIVRCLVEVHRSLRLGGSFFATYFEAPRPAHIGSIRHQPGDVITFLDSDPFHYSYEELAAAGRAAGLEPERIGEWGHPRSQQMIRFTRR